MRHELINRIIAIFRHLKWFGYIHCIIPYHFWWILLVVIFPTSCVYPNILRIICCLESESAIIWHPYEIPDFCTLNSPDLNIIYYKIWGNESTSDKSAGCEWFEAASDWCVSWSGTERLLTMALTTGTVVSMPAIERHRRTFWILSVTQISQASLSLIN